MKTTLHSVCALDCPDACSVLVDIEDGGRAVKLRGNPAHPITQGFLCGKVTRYLERAYHPDRLQFPMRRTGAKGEGRFEKIAWDEALGEIASRLAQISAQHGPESILPYSYAGTMGLLNGSGMDRRFFHRLGASRLDRTICSSAGGAALMASQGIRLGMEPEQFAQSKLILAWGANILGTNIHLWPWIVQARRKGAKLYVIDPVKNRTGRVADRHFAIYPGSDLALALGMIHVIFREGLEDADYIRSYADGCAELASLVQKYTPEHVESLTGIGRGDVESLAREYATTRPAAIRLNYGVQRSEQGGAAVRAIAALPVVTGAWAAAGGGLQLTTSGAFEFNRAALEREDLQLASPLKREARIVNMSKLGHALTKLDDPPVRALVVYNSNPAAIAPNLNAVSAGLRREDLFTVVLEQFATDTADFADIVLPVTSFLEHTDVYLAYGHYYLQLAKAALPPWGQSRSNVEIFRELAARMGFEESCFGDSEEEMIRALLSTESAYFKGITWERLDHELSIRLNVSPTGVPFLPFAKGGWRTANGKFQFGAESLEYAAPVESRFGDALLRERFPLELISSKNDDSMNSTFGHRDMVDAQTAVAEMHQSDAASRGIKTGERIRIFNDRGTYVARAKVSDSVAPGVVRCPSVRWPKRSQSLTGINTLTSERLTDLGGGPTFYSCLVQAELV